MFHSIEQFAYHILVLLLPVVIYHLFIKEEKQDREKIMSWLTLVLVFMLFLTMSNPVEFCEGYIYDFRVIPIIIAFLYGGVKPGITVLGMMFLYRFSVGGGGFYVTLINYTIAFLILVQIKRYFDSFSFRKKLIVISIFYWVIACTRALTLVLMGQSNQLTFLLIFSVITWVTTLILIFIIENVDVQIAQYQQIKHAERLNVISQLAASVAHEVRNPMTSIKGFLQLIRQDNNLDQRQKNFINISLEELERTETVINDYLSLAKPNTKDIEMKINVTSELKSMVDIITSYTNKNNIVIEASIQDELFSIGKKGELKQAILNMMKNSTEAIHSNGTLTVNAYKEQNEICIEIKDNGIGMTNKQIEQLGRPYYSTKDKGTGIGLTLSYKIIKDMNGHIIVKSKQGVGTTFKVELPAVEK